MNDERKTQREKLLSQRKNGYDRVPAQEIPAMERYCSLYKTFLHQGKTERECARVAVELAEKAGFKPYERGMELKPGDRIYRVNRGKSVMLAVIGKQSLEKGAQIVAAHIDSPRLDLKPNPMYEDSELGYFKTHYYGGIKKYQWTTTPLALHGVICRRDGIKIDVSIGEDPADPVLYIPDLLIHLAGDQMKKPLATGVTAEQLNVLLGSEPLAGDDGADRVKLALLNLLFQRYGITEADFLTAELTMVPAAKACEVGLDRSMIGAYGHDDRVCAYAAFAPLLDLDVPSYTAVCVLADKEEIGSVGVSGMQSRCFETFLGDLCQSQGVPLRRCLEHAFCLSADVTNAFDPTFADTCDRRNNAKLNYGIGVCKYTGARGKSGASDAAAEVVGYIAHLFDENDVIWQTATLGKVDQGGGGTVAAYMANRNIDTLDAGVPVLSMHAPMEVVSKLDAYMTAKGMRAFYEAP